MTTGDMDFWAVIALFLFSACGAGFLGRLIAEAFVHCMAKVGWLPSRTIVMRMPIYEERKGGDDDK